MKNRANHCIDRLRLPLLVAFAGVLTIDCERAQSPIATTECSPAVRIRSTGYHGDSARTGWNDVEPCLTPERVKAGLAPSWMSPPLDDATVDGVRFAPHGYATPLYLDDVMIRSPAADGERFAIVIAATSNGFVYAVAASASARVDRGTVLWRRSLGQPLQPARNRDGVPFGVLSTPTVDLAASPPRIYVTAADASAGWRAFALDLATGEVLPGWPIVLDDAALRPLDKNAPRDGSAPATMAGVADTSQRSALSLSPDGARLYVSWGSYVDAAVGWMAAIDTRDPRVVASFSGAPNDVPPDGTPDQNRASAGMWGAGGASVDRDGRVYMTTGNSPEGSGSSPGVWGNSVLAWNASLDLVATYSPFDYCAMDRGDTDLGGSSPLLFDLAAHETSTPRLVAFGGKQGNLYLVDRDRLPGGVVARPACDPDRLPPPSSDGSLLAPAERPYYSPPDRGPLNVFGPFSQVPGDNAVNRAKMRSTPAFFRDDSGRPYLFVAGSSRAAGDLETPRAPSLARVRVVTAPDKPAFLEVDAYAKDVVFQNPGAPIVTSHAGRDAVVWVLDANARRTDTLVAQGAAPAPRPILYAFGASTLELVGRVELEATGGKYTRPVVAHGTVFTVTDRVVAYQAVRP